MRVVAYVRVSTDRQAEEGLGLEIQERAIRQWARDNGHRLVAVCRDEGVSGSNGIDSRLGLADALEHLRGGADALAVYRLDRLARDLIVQEQLLAEVRRMGCRVFSTQAGEAPFLEDDPDDPSRELIRQVLGAVAQYERAMIVMRMRAGRRRKAERGGYAGGGIPLGWRSRSGELVIDSAEQDAVSRIHELHQVGLSTRQIAETMAVEGFQPRRGTAWHSMTVSRVLRKREPVTI